MQVAFVLSYLPLFLEERNTLNGMKEGRRRRNLNNCVKVQLKWTVLNLNFAFILLELDGRVVELDSDACIYEKDQFSHCQEFEISEEVIGETADILFDADFNLRLWISFGQEVKF